MTRRSVIRLLLSLLLLVSQQMAISHVITHWNSELAPRAQAVDDDSVSKAFAKDKSCGQCLAFAQIASGLANSPRSFAPPAAGAILVAANADHPRCARTVCAFRSRAPPGAV
ncbi:MAG: hypothetical protein ACJ8LG_09810 [Massilia sp.]